MITSHGTGVRRRWALAPLALLLTACGSLDELEYTPRTTPEQWCDQRPCYDVGDTVFSEPLGTFLVFTLAILWLVVGIYFVVSRAGQRSRLWFGVAAILGGIGAALAGTSYQAFSYVLKCEGWDYCRLTNAWEVGFSVSQALSVSAMLTAVAIACAAGGLRRALIAYAAINAVGYIIVTVIGVLAPSAVLLSFEVLMLFAVPGLILVMITAAGRYRREHDKMSRSLLIAIIMFLLVQVAYFGYYAAGITETLWDDGNGFYFSANDVLHVGLILWLAYVWRALGPTLRDLEESEDAVTAA